MSTSGSIEAAFNLHQAGNLLEAERLYRELLEAEPDNLNCLQLLGLLASSTGRTAEAVTLLERAAATLGRAGKPAAQHAALYNNLGNALKAAGRVADAIHAYRYGLRLDPKTEALHANLGAALLLQASFLDAGVSFQAALRLNPGNVESWCNLAAAHGGTGRHEEAVAAGERALALQPGYGPALSALATAQCSVARIRHGGGDLPDAEARYRGALRLQPDLVDALVNLAILLADTKRYAEAIDLCRQALLVQPENGDTSFVLGTALLGSGDKGAAIVALVRCLQLNSDSVRALYRLGVILSQQGLHVEAAQFLERAVALQPDHASAHGELGNVLQSLGRPDAAREAFLRAQQLRPITTVLGAKEKADFSILVVTAPGAGNTPYRYLVGSGAYDSHFLGLLPELTLDVDMFRAKGDVVVNLISDPDQGLEMLCAAGALIDRLDRPTVNHPRKILTTDREAVAAALVGIASCRVPHTRRCSAESLSAPDVAARLAPFAFPLLLRQAGTHGGDAFEKINEPGEIASFLAQHPSADYYVTEWADYRSNDDYFRKYRLIFTDNQIFPYHLAIHDDWKVHHYRTDMALHVWMQDEEAAFLEDPTRVFGKEHHAALGAIRARIALEFFGIDCSVDRDGNLVVFEVNASMLVHDDNADFPYKAPYVARIKRAFDAMLARMATASAGAAVASSALGAG